MAHIVNGVTIKNPDSFKIERYNVTTLERLANADMAGDLIAKKRKLYYTYTDITGAELDIILDAIWSATLFFPVVYEEGGTTKSMTAYVGSIPSELHRNGNCSDNVIWKGVSFNLIER